MSRPHQPANNRPPSRDELRRVLELELKKTRSEASAARLEARAVELELMLRKIGDPSNGEALHQRIDDASPDIPPPTSPLRVTTAHRCGPTLRKFGSWEDVRNAQLVATKGSAMGSISTPNAPATSHAEEQKTYLRIDSACSNVARPHFLDPVDARTTDEEIAEMEEAIVDDSNAQRSTQQSSETSAKFTLPEAIDHRSTKFSEIDQAFVGRVTETWSESIGADQQPRSKNKTGAWLVSAIAHVVILVALAAFGIHSHQPKDQVAFTASVSHAEEMVMESFSVEAAKIEVEPQEITEETPVEMEYELSPVGEMQTVEIPAEVSPAMESAMAASLSSNANQAAAKPISMKGESASKMRFCGVEGGGNHFVYLVDSSKSMKEGFDSARRALLSSIDLLKPEQRFYVVFFDADPDYMRVSQPDQDEPRSVYATPENKAAVRRWAMRVRKDIGKAPYDPIEFALSLKPDVIFLLSDGEFPERIVTLLRDENKIENLFGDIKPISIIHTISYHSQEGASIMKRIASQNSGQYQYVPKP